MRTALKYLSVSAAALLAGIGMSEAQDASEEVIVTAQKRSQNLQEVPISITALSGTKLEEGGVSSLQDLTRMTPGLNIGTLGGNSGAFTYIRGSGTNLIDMSADPSVATFIDEIYIPGTAGMQFGLLDIERIEVLKGPQGTLFGRNAAAGAISIVTRRPSDEFGGEVSLEVGNYGLWQSRASVTGPFSEGSPWQYRIAGMSRHRDPMTKNLSGGGDPGEVNNYGVRGQLEYEGEEIDALLTGGYYRSDDGPADVFTFTSGSVAGFLDAGGQAAIADKPNDFRRIWLDQPWGYQRQRVFDANLRLEWDTDIGTLTSITAYRDSSYKGTDDRDGTFADVMHPATHEDHETFSQELRFAYDSGAWSWIAGVYYYHDEGFSDQMYDVGPDMVLYVDTFGESISDKHWLTIDSIAVFGQLTYDITDELSLTVGARYTRDEKESRRDLFVDPMLYDFVIRNFIFPVGSYTAQASDSWEAFNPVGVIQYQVTPDIMVYGSVRSGFKSGGFPTGNPATPAIATTTYDPEDILSYEIGIRSELLDGKLRINSSVFYVEMSDQQVSIFESGALVVRNAADGTTEGIDLEIRALLTDNFSVDFSSTLQRARFEDFSYFSPILGAVVDNSGNHQLRSPDFSMSLGADYVVPLGESGDLEFHADYYWQSVIYFNDGNFRGNVGTYQPSYGLLNARITYTPPSGAWSAALWGRNLADEEYCSNIIVWTLDNVPNMGTGTCAPGDPLTYGVSLNYRF